MILIIENHDFRSMTTLICKIYLKNTNCCGNLKKIVKKRNYKSIAVYRENCYKIRNTMILIIKNHDFSHNYFDT